MSDDAEEVEPGDEMPDPTKPRLRQRWQYKRRRNILDLDDPTLLTRIAAAASMGHTKKEAAMLMGVSKDYFLEFLDNNPEVSEAWEDGKALRRVRARVLLNQHAQHDPATARFLAKAVLPEFKEGVQPATPEDVAALGAPPQRNRDTLIARIVELHGKLPLPPPVAPAQPRPKESPFTARRK